MPCRIAGLVLSISLLVFSMSSHATGMLPDTPLLVISAGDGTAQMGLRNTDNVPLLLYTTVTDLPNDKGPALYAIPPVIRVEPNGRQVVRFLLERTAEPITVQHMKRVQFEGIPPRVLKEGESEIQVNVRQDIPVVISPKGLEQDPTPWKKLKWQIEGNRIMVSNPSPFVVRLSQQVDLMPGEKRVKLFERTYVLPGESFTYTAPSDVNLASLDAVRLFPASPYGFDVGSYDVALNGRNSVSSDEGAQDGKPSGDEVKKVQ